MQTRVPRKGGTPARSARCSRQHESRLAGIGRCAREHPATSLAHGRLRRHTYRPPRRPRHPLPQPTRDRRRQPHPRPSHRAHQAPRDRARACSTSSSARSHSPTIPKPPNSSPPREIQPLNEKTAAARPGSHGDRPCGASLTETATPETASTTWLSAHWRLSTITPKVLRPDDETRAIAIRLPGVEELQADRVHERTYPLVADVARGLNGPARA
jgi:hypothetical protein